jgi:glutamyl-Q tRNA(Asp) synthetase
VASLRRRLPARPRTRFAPSPTGFLHLGHVVNALYVWGLARALGGEVVLRIEDHDRARCRPAYVEAILDDLAWLGFEATPLLDAQPAWRQSAHTPAYDDALAQLRAQGHALFWCECSRRDIQATAPAPAGAEVPYPMTCAARGLAQAPGRSLRLALGEGCETFDDGRLGLQAQAPRAQCGALLLVDRDACWTYQFAVTVDDLRHDIDLVVRGEDLLDSTGRQIQLGRLLGRPAPAVFVHHPLIRHAHGDKLSKSNRDTGVGDLRRAGWSPARVIGHAAWRVGLTPDEAPHAAAEAASLVVQTP